MAAHEKTNSYEVVPSLPRSFLLRRLHSLTGAWISFYLLFHLFVNVQAAFYFGNGAIGFIELVNFIHKLPWLEVIEITFLGLPFLIHGVLGVQILLTGRMNSFPNNGSSPSLTRYPRNHAYSWQRITAWVLLVGIALHVFQMRFLNSPERIREGPKMHYQLTLTPDPGLEKIAKELDVVLEKTSEGTLQALSSKPGTLFFLEVRAIFSSLWMVIVYSLFVIAATFHGFNGLWTFMITWGITLSYRSQRWMRWITNAMMAVATLFGLGAVWGLYFSFWS